jgi:hypothetical protein
LGVIRAESWALSTKVENQRVKHWRNYAEWWVTPALLWLARAATYVVSLFAILASFSNANADVFGLLEFTQATHSNHDTLLRSCSGVSTFSETDEVLIFTSYMFYRFNESCIGEGYGRYCKTQISSLAKNSCGPSFYSRGPALQSDAYLVRAAGLVDPFAELDGHELPMIFWTERHALFVFIARDQILSEYEKSGEK